MSNAVNTKEKRKKKLRTLMPGSIHPCLRAPTSFAYIRAHLFIFSLPIRTYYIDSSSSFTSSSPPSKLQQTSSKPTSIMHIAKLLIVLMGPAASLAQAIDCRGKRHEYWEDVVILSLVRVNIQEHKDNATLPEKPAHIYESGGESFYSYSSPIPNEQLTFPSLRRDLLHHQGQDLRLLPERCPRHGSRGVQPDHEADRPRLQGRR